MTHLQMRPQLRLPHVLLLLLLHPLPTLAAGDSAGPRAGRALRAWHVPRLASSEVSLGWEKELAGSGRCCKSSICLCEAVRAALRWPQVPQGELKCFGRGRGQDGLGMGAFAGHGCRTWCRTVAEAASHLQCWCLARAARAGPRVSSNMHCGRLP